MRLLAADKALTRAARRLRVESGPEDRLGGAIYDALGPSSVFVACACALGLAMLIMLAAIARGVFPPGTKPRP